jgi:GT2 family glycosyltransferase
VQVLDDSTDRTSVLIRRLVRVMRRSGLDVRHLRRPHRAGYKAGALAAGLRVARGELIAIFDADFVPPPDFLRRMVPHVLRPGVGVVQARWSHLNRDDSWFTRLQAVLLDGHFAIEQPARAASGCLLSFNGTGGVWRREAITSAGGWSSDTLTEDLDLSLRAQLCGWRVTYCADVLVPGELPRDPNSFRTQQRRWTKGGVQVARKLLPAILRSGLRPLAKLEILLRFASYAGYPLLIALALLRAPLRALVPRQGFIDLLPGEPVLLGFGTLPLVIFYVLAQRGAGAPGHFRRWLGQGLGAMALGAGLAVGNTLAVLGGLFDRDLRFERTPKLGGARRMLPSAPYRAGGTGTATLEIALLTVLVAGKFIGTSRMWLGEIPFLAFFGFGLILLAAPSFRRASAPPPFGAAHTLLDAPGKAA